jgi:uncharacterized protein (DUF1778 family)
MPRIRIHVPEDQLKLLKEAAVRRLTTIENLMVEAAVERAQAVLREFKPRIVKE